MEFGNDTRMERLQIHNSISKRKSGKRGQRTMTLSSKTELKDYFMPYDGRIEKYRIKTGSDALVYLDEYEISTLFRDFTRYLKAEYFASSHTDTMKMIAKESNKSLEEIMEVYPMLTDKERTDIIRTMVKEEIRYRKIFGRAVPEPTSSGEPEEYTIKTGSDALVYLDEYEIFELFSVFTSYLKAEYLSSSHTDTMKMIAKEDNQSLAYISYQSLHDDTLKKIEEDCQSLEETIKKYPMLTDQERTDIIRTMVKQEIRDRKWKDRPVPEDKEE